MHQIRRFWAFCKRRKEDFAFDFIVWVMMSLTGAVMCGIAKWLATPEVASWLIPTMCLATVVGVVVFPIVRELRRPRAIVTISSGATIGKIIYPIDPTKAAKGKYFEDQSLNISSLVSDGSIVGKTCKNCDLYGPAVLALDQKSRVGGEWERRKDADIKIPLIDPSRPPAGVIILVDSAFDACRFHNIGIVDERRAVIDESGS